MSIRQLLYTRAKEIALQEGWSLSLQKAARSLDIPPTEISHHFPNGNYDVIKSLMKEWNQNLLKETTKSQELSAESIIQVGTKRLSSLIPFSHTWAEAMKIGAHPENLVHTTEILWDTFDLILVQAGDVFDPVSYPVKRMAIGGLFVATETKMARDPVNSQKHLECFSEGVYKADKALRFGNTVCIFGKFFTVTWSGVFYPQPSVHKNPMPSSETSS